MNAIIGHEKISVFIFKNFREQLFERIITDCGEELASDERGRLLFSPHTFRTFLNLIALPFQGFLFPFAVEERHVDLKEAH